MRKHITKACLPFEHLLTTSRFSLNTNCIYTTTALGTSAEQNKLYIKCLSVSPHRACEHIQQKQLFTYIPPAPTNYTQRFSVAK